MGRSGWMRRILEWGLKRAKRSGGLEFGGKDSGS